MRQPTHVLCSRGQEFNRSSEFNGGANGTWTEYREVAAGSDVFCSRQTIRRDLAGPGTSVQGQHTLRGRIIVGKRGEANLIVRCVAAAEGSEVQALATISYVHGASLARHCGDGKIN